MKNRRPDSPPPGKNPSGKYPTGKNPAPGRPGTGKPGAKGAAARRTTLRRKKIRPWWYGFLVSVGLMTVLAAGALGIFIAIIYTMAPDDPFEDYTPGEVTRMFDRDGARLIGEFRDKDGEQRVLVRLEDIPDRLKNAFICVEDARFWDHFGVDVIGIVRAFLRHLTGRSFEGASTITMQLPRNMSIVGREKTMTRKIKEALLAVWIERHYSKSQILEFYLNQINLGGNICGVRLAADKYFSKELNELTLGECATLAGIPKSPTKYNPLLHPADAMQRRNTVLSRMLQVGKITEQECLQAKAEKLITRPGKSQVSTGSLYPYFTDGLETDLHRFYRAELEQLDKEITAKKKVTAKAPKGRNGQKGSEQHDDPVLRGLQTAGLRITTTIDPQVQKICEEAVRTGLVSLEKMWQSKKAERQPRDIKVLYRKGWDGKLRPNLVILMEIVKVREKTLAVRFNRYAGEVNIPEIIPFYNPDIAIKAGQLLDVRVTEVDESNGTFKGEFADPRPMQGSMVVMDVHNGEVLAMVGGSGFASDKSGWVNQAMSGARQMGSCFKPLFYAAAFEKGFQPSDIIIDEPIEFGTARAPYRPTNYEHSGNTPQFFKANTLIEALEHSRNVTTIRLFEALRVPRAMEIVRKFDFAYGYGQPQWKIPSDRDVGMSICLGTVTSSPFVLASAYQAIANLGVGVRPQFIRSIVDTQGRIPFPIKKPEFEVIRPMTACQAQYLMRQVVVQVEDGATGREVGRKFPSPPFPPICGKTGTTDDCRDAWFAAFTPDLVIVSQIGFDPPRSMAPGMTGGTTAATQMWIPAYEKIYKTRRNWSKAFEKPDEPVEYADICARTGKRASDVCSSGGHKVFHAVPFSQGKAPRAYCNGEIQVPIIAPMPTGDYGSYAAQSPVRSLAHPVTGSFDYDYSSPE